MAAVMLAGYWAAQRSTRLAVDTLETSQVERVPLVNAAEALSNRLVAYDRAILDQLRDDDAETRAATREADDRLIAATEDYLARRPDAASERWLNDLHAHIASGARLTETAQARQGALSQHGVALQSLTRRIAVAFEGNAKLPDPALERRAYADLELALGSVRDAFNRYLVAPEADTAAGVESAHARFRSSLMKHGAELLRAPGKAWVELVQEDFAVAARRQRQVVSLDREINLIREQFARSGSVLPLHFDVRLATPARRAVAASADDATAATRSAERTLFGLTIAVLSTVLLVSCLTMLAVTRPVRHLIRATRAFASGEWRTRVPLGGPRELDELALAFNQMAEQLSATNQALQQHQSELERRVRSRTRKLNYLAHHDSLTTLPNRRYAFSHLRRAVRRAKSRGSALSLLVVDLDNFKVINDNLGHTVGDELLRAVADRLRAWSQERHFVGRLGGDEFVAIVDRSASIPQTEALAAHLVEVFREPIEAGGRELLVSVTIGISTFPRDARDAAALVQAADAALFRAKGMGRNRVAMFSPAMLEGSASRFRTEQALRRAIEAQQLLLVYQPQVSLETGSVTSIEALMRWRREDGTLVSASDFIHVAEQSGLIIELGDWALETAVEAISGWRNGGWPDVRVALNVSMHQFLDNGFVDRIARTLERFQLPASALELELTESAFQTGSGTVDAIRHARALGCGIALDDFGTGYSSLTSLSQLPLRRVKLDRSLIAEVGKNLRSAAIARSIIGVCHSLGLDVTVEGIERSEQLAFLTHCGAVDVQGHLIAWPMERKNIAGFAAGASRHVSDLVAAATRNAIGERRQQVEGVIQFKPGVPRR